MADKCTEDLLDDPLVIDFLRRQSRPESRQSSIAPSCPENQETCSKGALLLELPVEMVIRIATQLNASDQAAFHITCKALYHLLAGIRPPLSGSTQAVFLKRLERDPRVGDHLYYCSICVRLHGFDPWWTPQDWHASFGHAMRCRWWFHHRNALYKPHSWYVFSTTLFPHAVRVRYHHGRLVMNRHRHGARHGMPLARLRVDKTSWTCASEVPGNQLSRTAEMEPRIINDELFLRITSTVAAADDSNFSLEELREHVKALRLRVCSHAAMKLETPRHAFKPAWLLGFYERWRPSGGASWSPLLAWAPYVSSRTRTVVDSCSACATDAASWYELRRDEGPEGDKTDKSHRWVFTLESYHQLGPCRRPEDFQRRGFLWCGWEAEVFRPRGYRDLVRDVVADPEGAVLVRWQAGDAQLLDYR